MKINENISIPMSEVKGWIEGIFLSLVFKGDCHAYCIFLMILSNALRSASCKL